MTETQPSNNHAGNMLTEAAVDGLLRDFFRLEVPATALSHPPTCPTATVSTVTAVRPPGHPAKRLAVAVSLTVLPLCLLLMFGRDHRPQIGTGLAEKQNTPAASDSEQLLPVSSVPDAKNASVPLDENGLLLQETEQIQLNPGK
jgi:hypothetical protein